MTGLVDYCAHDNEAGLCPQCDPQPVRIVREPEWGHPFAAAYLGRCAVCEGGIQAGEPIRMRRWPNGDREYAHLHCTGGAV